MSSPYSHSDIFPFIVSIKCTYLLALILYLCCILFFKHPLKWFHKSPSCRYISEVVLSSVYRHFLVVLLSIFLRQIQSSHPLPILCVLPNLLLIFLKIPPIHHLQKDDNNSLLLSKCRTFHNVSLA